VRNGIACDVPSGVDEKLLALFSFSPRARRDGKLKRHSPSAAVDLRAVDEGLDDVRPGVQRVPVPDRQVGILAGLDGPHPLLQPQMLGGSSLAFRV